MKIITKTNTPKLNIPSAVEWILAKLKLDDYEAFVVGGCVRDSILGIPPHDWDICTSATPDEIMEVFSDYKIIPTGLKHGTVTVILNDEPYEITTYRIDGDYEDSRHPDNVMFTKSLEEDLARRDFTINAMAYNPEVGIVDIYNGYKDLEDGILRCVGNPKDRFSEDALRIMRAIRFAAIYNLCIDLDTISAMNEYKWKLKNISSERINSELLKMMKANSRSLAFTFSYTAECLFEVIPELKEVFDSGLIERITKTNYPTVKIALLFDFSEEKQREVMKRLKFSNSIINEVVIIRKYGSYIRDKINDFENLNYSAKLILNQIGYYNSIYAIFYALAYMESVHASNNQLSKVCALHDSMKQILEKDECYQLSTLAVNGNDVMAAGYRDKEVGVILNYLLEMVMRGTLSNDYDVLINRINELKK